MGLKAKDVASGLLPITVANAEEARAEDMSAGTGHYATYTTESGTRKDLDDGQIKDEN